MRRTRHAKRPSLLRRTVLRKGWPLRAAGAAAGLALLSAHGRNAMVRYGARHPGRIGRLATHVSHYTTRGLRGLGGLLSRRRPLL
jgi:hypothetical protein